MLPIHPFSETVTVLVCARADLETNHRRSLVERVRVNIVFDAQRYKFFALAAPSVCAYSLSQKYSLFFSVRRISFVLSGSLDAGSHFTFAPRKPYFFSTSTTIQLYSLRSPLLPFIFALALRLIGSFSLCVVLLFVFPLCIWHMRNCLLLFFFQCALQLYFFMLLLFKYYIIIFVLFGLFSFPGALCVLFCKVTEGFSPFQMEFVFVRKRFVIAEKLRLNK